MSDLLLGTLAVNLDEPCLLLKEEHLNWQSRGIQRVQTMVVIRNDKPAEFTRVLGPVTKFAGVTEFRIPGGVTDEPTGRITIEHTVGELVDIANDYRLGVERVPEIEPSDLVTGYHESRDQKKARRNGRVVSGPRR